MPNWVLSFSRLLKESSTALPLIDSIRGLITQIRKNDYTDIYRYFKEI